MTISYVIVIIIVSNVKFIYNKYNFKKINWYYHFHPCKHLSKWSDYPCLLGPSHTLRLFLPLNIGYLQKKANLKQRGAIFSKRKVKSINFFMKWHLLHNIYNNDNKNGSKIKTKVESCFAINFCHQLRREKNLKPSFIANVCFWSQVLISTLGSPPQ